MCCQVFSFICEEFLDFILATKDKNNVETVPTLLLFPYNKLAFSKY